MSYPEQQMQNHIEAGINEADRCYARINELEAQNAELVATIEALRKFANSWNPEDASADPAFSDTFFDLINESPQQCLRDVKVEAVSDFIEFMHQSGDCQLCEKSLEVASQYAARVKAGDK